MPRHTKNAYIELESLGMEKRWRRVEIQECFSSCAAASRHRPEHAPVEEGVLANRINADE